MKKFKKFFKRFKKILSKIVNDKQLLTIFTLMIVVIVVGCIAIGVLRTFIIIASLAGIAFFAKFIIDKKKGLENNNDNISEIDSGGDEVMSKKKKSKKKKIEKNKVLSTLVNVFLVFVLCCIVGGFLFIGYIAMSAPDFNPSNLYRKESSIMYASDGSVIAKLGTELRDTITFDDMPQVLIDAIIATEDSRFYQHNGVDLPRFLKASAGQLLGHSGAGGASTITMQISKKAYTGDIAVGIRGIIRKFTDIYMAVFKLEKNYTKEQILEYYVNIPFLGSHSYGVSEAANTYFGKSVSDLNLSEAALIAGLFQAPTAYDPYVHPQAASERRATVLRLMKRHGYITEEEEEMANSISVESLLSTKSYTNEYQNFIDVVVDEIYEKTGENPYNTPMKIYTTLDKDKQNHLNSIINGDKYTWVNDKVQVGVAVTDVENGGIVAISGGRNTVALGLNRATDLNNQPGSTAKPLFDYAPGVEYNNWSTYTPFIDEPHGYTGGSQIKNWDGSYYGFLTLRQSLGLSRNIPALKAFQNAGRKNIEKFVTSVGIEPEKENGVMHEGHALGSFNGTNPLEMAAAYAVFANGGYYIEPYTVTKIVYLDSNQVKEYKPSKTKVISDSTAYIITNSLIWAVDSGLSSGARIYGRQVAAKTGTTDFYDVTIKEFGLPYDAVKDYWVVGYTPKISIGLWYGYDKITEGYNTLADNNRKDRVFNLIMSGMLSDSPKNFTTPKSVVSVQVEKDTIPAMLPSDDTPSDKITTEYFKSGTEPTTVSPVYKKLNNPNNFTVSLDKKIATLTWDSVKIPEYFTDEWAEKYFIDGMGDFKTSYTKYHKKQIEKLGEFGYDIYIVDSSGSENYVTTTTDTKTTIDISKYSGDIKFVVKTAWKNDKTTSSSGSEYTLSTAPISLVSVMLKGKELVTLNIGDVYFEKDPPVTVLNNFKDVTSDAVITKVITNSNNEIVNEITTDKEETFKISYKITYNNTTYDKVRTINIKEKS